MTPASQMDETCEHPCLYKSALRGKSCTLEKFRFSEPAGLNEAHVCSALKSHQEIDDGGGGDGDRGS